MLYVTDLQNRTEPLNHVQRVEVTEEVSGAYTLALTSFFHANNPGHELLEEESIITVEGYDFRVKQLRENKGRKEIVAISTFFDLGGKWKDDIYGGTHTFDEFVTFVLSGTGWTFEAPSIMQSAMIPNFGKDNALKLIDTLCKTFDCEYKIMPNNHVIFADQIGPDNDFQFRYKHNIKTIRKSVETTNLRTVIKGHGASGLVVTYTSPNVSKYGAIEAEPIVDEEILTSAEFTPILQRELQDIPEVAFELDNAELLDRDIGERVWLIYEPMDIEFQTRIMSKSSTIRNGKLITQSVVIGNKVPRTMQDITTDIKVDIDENEKKTRSRFEQTNERITLEVERIDESIAQIIIEADEIKLSVEAVEESIGEINIRADAIVISVRDLGDRVGSAESAITVNSDEIDLRVTKDGVISAINLSPELARIEAKNIQLVGAVEVLSDITGDLGLITAGDIDIHNEIKVGNGIYLRGEGKKGLYFDDDSQVFSSGGEMTIEAFNDVNIVGTPIRMYGALDLTNVNGITWGNNRPTAVWG